MANDEDHFRIRPGRVRDRAGGRTTRAVRPRPKTFLAEVHQAIRRAGGDPNRLGSAGKGSGRFNARGRGATAAAGLKGRSAWSRDASGGRTRARRVTVKARIVKLNPQRGAARGRSFVSAKAVDAHLRYLERDGVNRDGEKGQVYSAERDAEDGRAFLDRGRDDRHQFRFIVSAEEGVELADLRETTRDLMKTMEADLGTRLDWIAVDHHNTGHPHTHILLRGVTDDGKILNIAGDYIAHGIRERASEIVTLELGRQTEQEVSRQLEREVDAERFTRLDRMLIAEQEASHAFADLRPDQDMLETARRNRALLIARARRLESMGLATEVEVGRWSISRTGGADACANWASAATSSRPCTGRWPTTASPTNAPPRNMRRTASRSPNRSWAACSPRAWPATRWATGCTSSSMAWTGAPTMSRWRTPAAWTRSGAAISSRSIRRRPRPSPGRRMSTSRSWRKPMAASTGRACIWKRRGTSSSSATATRTPSFAPMCAGWKPCAAPGTSSASTPTIGKSPATSPSEAWPMTPPADPRIFGIRTLSTLDLDRQVGSDGATWLDRELVAKDHLPLAGTGFGQEVNAALDRRAARLVEMGHASVKDGFISIPRRTSPRWSARRSSGSAKRWPPSVDLTYSPSGPGEYVSGRLAGVANLASGRFAMIEDGLGFQLVPWQPVLEKRLDQHISGVRRDDGGIEWSFSRKRQIGLGL